MPEWFMCAAERHRSRKAASLRDVNGILFVRVEKKRQVADVPESVDGRCCGRVADGHVLPPCAGHPSCQSIPYRGPEMGARSDSTTTFLVKKPWFCGPQTMVLWSAKIL